MNFNKERINDGLTWKSSVSRFKTMRITWKYKIGSTFFDLYIYFHFPILKGIWNSREG